jgi:hypothetical protein
MIVWVASYPKSGNTFLRILLSDYLYGDLNLPFNFSNLSKIEMFPNLFRYNPLLDEKIINDIKEVKKVDYIYKYSLFLQKKLFSNGTHFLKTHSSNFNINEHVFTNHEITSCALYIVRDPRNVLLSYSDYQNKPVNLVYQEMTEEIIQRQKYKNDWYPICHMGSWQSNFNSWKKAQLSFPVKIIKYENLVSNTSEVFFDILNFLNRFANIDINILKMNSVIKRTEFNNLKKLEDDGFFNEMNDFKKDNKFFKLGKERNWKNNSDVIEYANYISNFYKKEIENLGY